MPVAMKYLDLDAIHRPEGRIRIGEVDYDVYPISVKALVNLAVLTEATENTEDGTYQISKAIDVIEEIFPACPRTTLESLSMKQINLLIEFCGSLGEEAVEKNSDAPTKTKKTKQAAKA